MLVGIPGSGKSTYAKELKSKGYLIYSSDEARKETDNTDNTVLFDALHKQILSDLKNGKDYVLYATNLGRKRRISFLDQIGRTNVKRVCDLFVAPPDICKERNRKREDNHGVTDEVIDRMVSFFQCPWYTDGFEEIHVHSYTGPFDMGYTREDLMAFSQDNSHHTLTVGEHEEKVYEYIKEKYIFTEHFPFLLAAAKYHDDGKYFTKQFIDSRGNPSEDAHYYQHDNVSSYLFLLRGFCLRQFDQPEEYTLTTWAILYVATLINLHMRPHHAWDLSSKVREKDEKRYGEEMCLDLLHLAEADLYGK